MPLKSAAYLSYSLPQQQHADHRSAEELEQAYKALCSDDETPEWESGRAKAERRAAEARELARRYTGFLGFDMQQAQGRAMLEKTARFYGQSDGLLMRLRQLVEQFCSGAQGAAAGQ